jgi:hypothetical protein
MTIALNYYIPWHFDLVTSWFAADDYELFLPFWYIKPYVKGMYGIVGFLSGKLLLKRPEILNSLTFRGLLVVLGSSFVATAIWS